MTTLNGNSLCPTRAEVLPSKYFGANAAWLRLVVMALNVLAALMWIALPVELLTARPKRLRFLIFNQNFRSRQHRFCRSKRRPDRNAIYSLPIP